MSTRCTRFLLRLTFALASGWSGVTLQSDVRAEATTPKCLCSLSETPCGGSPVGQVSAGGPVNNMSKDEIEENYF